VETLTKGFGYLIAFVLPGLVALCGISLLSSDVASWLGSAASSSTSVGVFLLVICAALTLGLILSGVRALAIDPFLPKPPQGHRAPESEVIYQNLIAQHYTFYQFYGNLMPAVLLVAVGAAAGRFPTGLGATIVGLAAVVVAEVFLFFSARHALARLREKVSELFDYAGQRPEAK
jgi:hypothetical protein